MRIPQMAVMASALLLAAGCARERQNAQYDRNFSPPSSAGQYDSDQSGASANIIAGRAGSQSDNTIVASVRELLQRNVEIAPIVPNIQISANNGAVILSGSVQSNEQKRQIEAIAQQANGVVAINNQLQVISGPPSAVPGTENQPANPLLNPTSSNSDNSPKMYQNPGSGPDNSNTNALNPTSKPEGMDRLYQGGNEQQMHQEQKLNPTSTGSSTQNSNSNTSTQTSRPNGAGKIYPEQNGQAQTTNSNQSTNVNQMP